MVGERYYSPELCRFIRPADVSSLNPHSINGLNLYCYANNNKIGSTVLNSYNFNTTNNYMNINIRAEVNAVNKNNKRGLFSFYKGVPVFIIPDSN